MSNDAFQGLQSLSTFGSEFNAQTLFVRSILARIHTATLVKVVACTNAGGVSAVGTVDVQPLINQVDGDGNMTVHAVVHKLPYFRLQGGANAIICDPQPGDIGVAVFVDRDASTVIATKAQANPGSGRWFDMADGMYFGGMLNAAPVQYVQFVGSDLHVTSTTGKVVLTDKNGSVVTMNGDGTGAMTFDAGLTVNANVTVNGWVEATGEGTFNGGHTVSQHTHTQGVDSHGDTEVPTDKPQG